MLPAQNTAPKTDAKRVPMLVSSAQCMIPEKERLCTFDSGEFYAFKSFTTKVVNKRPKGDIGAHTQYSIVTFDPELFSLIVEKCQAREEAERDVGNKRQKVQGTMSTAAAPGFIVETAKKPADVTLVDAEHGYPCRAAHLPPFIVASANRLDDPEFAKVSMQHIHVWRATRENSRLHYIVPNFCNLYRPKELLQWPRRRKLCDEPVRMTDVANFGRYRNSGLTWEQIARRDPLYIEWVRNEEKVRVGPLENLQVCINKWDMKRNAKVAWRRARWILRVANALWNASERGAMRRGAYATPDKASVAADLPGLFAD